MVCGAIVLLAAFARAIAFCCASLSQLFQQVLFFFPRRVTIPGCVARGTRVVFVVACFVYIVIASCQNARGFHARFDHCRIGGLLRFVLASFP